MEYIASVERSSPQSKTQFVRKPKPQICRKLYQIIDSNLNMMSSLSFIETSKTPILMKLPSTKSSKTSNDDPASVISDSKILKLLDEVECVNKIQTLYDPSFGHLLVVKFMPMYQTHMHWLVASVDNDLLITSPKEKQQLLGHLAMIKSLLEAIYAS